MSASQPHVFLHLNGNHITGLSPPTFPDPELLDRMAADLRKYDAATDEGDAMRSLMQCGYAPADIVRLVDKARAHAGSFDSWLERVEALTAIDDVALICSAAVNAFAEGMTAADYALQLQAASAA